MTLKLSDLIAAYGDNEVIFQNLDDCADALNWSAKNGSRITFRTSEVVTLEGTNKLGLVVWLDRKRVAEIVAELLGEEPDDEPEFMDADARAASRADDEHQRQMEG